MASFPLHLSEQAVAQQEQAEQKVQCATSSLHLQQSFCQCRGKKQTGLIFNEAVGYR